MNRWCLVQLEPDLACRLHLSNIAIFGVALLSVACAWLVEMHRAVQCDHGARVHERVFGCNMLLLRTRVHILCSRLWLSTAEEC